jgi:hypothetical protein
MEVPAPPEPVYPTPIPEPQATPEPVPVPDPPPPDYPMPMPAYEPSPAVALHASNWFGVRIIGEGPRAPGEFYLIPQGVCDQVPNALAQGCLAFILQNAGAYGYGPSPSGSERMMRAGDYYYAVPRCGPSPRWVHRQVLSASHGTRELRIRCPQ